MTDRQPLISIIIPIFNKQKYVEKCLESLFDQTYTNIEVIVVDDCSTDSSHSKVNKILNGRPGCRVLSNDRNMGHLNSRYVGIDNSSGEYITFMDADDWMEPDAIHVMVEAMSDFDADLVQIRNQRRMKGIAVKYREKFSPELAGRLIKGEEFRSIASYVGMDSYIFPACWGKLYRADRLREMQRIDFKQFWGEDQIFNIQYLRECKSMVFCDYVGYNYRWGGQTTAIYKYSALKEYKHVHHLKRMLGQDRNQIDVEINMLLRYHVRSLITELGYTREAVEMIMKEELRDPIWKTAGMTESASELVEEAVGRIQRSPMKYLAKRLLK